LEKMKEDSAEFMNISDTLMDIVDKSMRTNLIDLKEAVEALKWKVKATNESYRVANKDFDFLMETRRGIFKISNKPIYECAIAIVLNFSLLY